MPVEQHVVGVQGIVEGRERRRTGSDDPSEEFPRRPGDDIAAALVAEAVAEVAHQTAGEHAAEVPEPLENRHSGTGPGGAQGRHDAGGAATHDPDLDVGHEGNLPRRLHHGP